MRPSTLRPVAKHITPRIQQQRTWRQSMIATRSLTSGTYRVPKAFNEPNVRSTIAPNLTPSLNSFPGSLRAELSGTERIDFSIDCTQSAAAIESASHWRQERSSKWKRRTHYSRTSIRSQGPFPTVCFSDQSRCSEKHRCRSGCKKVMAGNALH